MAISRGLTMAIANPSQDLLMHAAFASDLLMNRPGSDIRYIDRMNAFKEAQTGESSNGSGYHDTRREDI